MNEKEELKKKLELVATELSWQAADLLVWLAVNDRQAAIIAGKREADDLELREIMRELEKERFYEAMAIVAYKRYLKAGAGSGVKPE